MNIIAESNFKNVYTPLSNVFINKYMPSANAVFVCIYIYSLNKCFIGEDFSVKIIAETFGILESDVLNAFKYWKEKGIIDFNYEESEEYIYIKFLETVETEAEKTTETAKVNSNDKAKERFFMRVEKPQYTSEEFEVYQSKSPEAKRLFSLAQNILGRMLTFTDMSTIYGIYDWLGMSIELIEKLLNFCVYDMGQRKVAYIERVAIDWIENGIDTVEAAEEHIEIFNNGYKKIMSAFGLKNSPVKEQQKYMKKWLKEFKFPYEIIDEACGRTVVTLGKADFKYADSILKEWFSKGVKSLDDIKKADDEFEAGKRNSATPSSKNSYSKGYYNKPSKFVNYEQRDLDFEKLNKLKSELLDKKLKG